MIRFAFTLLAALGIAAALTLWRSPESSRAPSAEVAAADAATPPSEDEAQPRAAAPAPAEAEGHAPEPRPAATPAPGAPASPETRLAEAEPSPPPSPSPAEPVPSVSDPVRPTLEEEPVEVVSRPDFAAAGAPVAVPGEEVASADDAPGPAPEPVDVDRSGELIRRMLALYRSVSE